MDTVIFLGVCLWSLRAVVGVYDGVVTMTVSLKFWEWGIAPAAARGTWLLGLWVFFGCLALVLALVWQDREAGGGASAPSGGAGARGSPAKAVGGGHKRLYVGNVRCCAWPFFAAIYPPHTHHTHTPHPPIPPTSHTL